MGTRRHFLRSVGRTLAGAMVAPAVPVLGRRMPPIVKPPVAPLLTSNSPVFRSIYLTYQTLVVEGRVTAFELENVPIGNAKMMRRQKVTLSLLGAARWTG